MSITQDLIPTTTTDPEAVAARLLEHLQRAWNDADGAAFSAVFTDDCDFVDIRGDHHRGAMAVGAGHQAIFDTIYRGSTLTYTTEAARQVAPGVIVAVAGGRLECPTGPLQGVNRSRFTVVAVQRASGWALAAFHNTLVREGS